MRLKYKTRLNGREASEGLHVSDFDLWGFFLNVCVRSVEVESLAAAVRVLCVCVWIHNVSWWFRRLQQMSTSCWCHMLWTPCRGSSNPVDERNRWYINALWSYIKEKMVLVDVIVLPALHNPPPSCFWWPRMGYHYLKTQKHPCGFLNTFQKIISPYVDKHNERPFLFRGKSSSIKWGENQRKNTYAFRIPPAAQRGQSSKGCRRSSKDETHPSCRTTGIKETI